MIKFLTMINNDNKTLKYKNLIDSKLGFLKEYIEDDNITEIVLNYSTEIWIESIRHGWVNTRKKYHPEDSLALLKVIADMNGTTIGEKNQELKGTIDFYKIRVQGLIPPAVKTPFFAFRISRSKNITLEDMVSSKSMDTDTYNYLREAVLNEKNILVIGSTSSGKTTMVEALLKVIEESNEHIFIIEDTPEITCNAKNKSPVLTNKNLTVRDAVRVAKRFNPDRIIVGELRGGEETMELLKAFNTGHDGGFTTLHANDAITGLNKLLDFILEVAINAPKRMVNDAIDICIHLKAIKIPNVGKRRVVSEIIELKGFNSRGWEIKEIYKYK